MSSRGATPDPGTLDMTNQEAARLALEWEEKQRRENPPPAYVQSGSVRYHPDAPEGTDPTIEPEHSWKDSEYEGTKIISSPEGGEEPAEAAESWRALGEEGQALADAPSELYYEKILPAGDVLRSKWGLPGWIRGDLVPEVNAILALEAKGMLQLDPALKADLEGYKAVDRQADRASGKSRKWRQEQEAKHGASRKDEFEERAQQVEEEFPEAKKKSGDK